MRSSFNLGMTLLLTAMLGCASKAKTGALIGAGTGAALGAGIGALAGKGKGAAIGAGVGAIVGVTSGALIGRYMDKQEEELKKLEAAKVERQGDKLVVQFNSAILFDTNKAELKPAAKSDLTEFANVLKSYPETDLIIEGHTDSTGKKDYNKKLSEKRAEAVITFLSSAGVERTRLTGLGYGDEKPMADNTSNDGRQKNRRVEIQIKANQKLQEQDAAQAQAQNS